MNANATLKSAPDAGVGAFTKEFRSRTGSRRVGKRDRFSYSYARNGPGAAQTWFTYDLIPTAILAGRGIERTVIKPDGWRAPAQMSAV